MLNREGLGAFSLRKLSQRLKVSHTAPYRHFSDKEDLLRGIVEEATSKFRHALELSVAEPPPSEAGEQDNPRERLMMLGVGYVKFYLENPEILTLFNLLSDQAVFHQGPHKDQQPPAFPGGERCGSTGLDELSSDEGFELFRLIAREAAPFHPDLTEREILLGYWSKVHGLASILVSVKGLIPSDELDTTLRKVLNTPF